MAHPSAIWLRQELPVQRKRIFVLWLMKISENSGCRPASRHMELDVGQLCLGGIAASQFQHLRGHVDADGLAGRPDLPGGQEHVQATTASEIDGA